MSVLINIENINLTSACQTGGGAPEILLYGVCAARRSYCWPSTSVMGFQFWPCILIGYTFPPSSSVFGNLFYTCSNHIKNWGHLVNLDSSKTCLQTAVPLVWKDSLPVRDGYIYFLFTKA